MHRAVKDNTLIRLNTMLLVKKKREKGKKDRERERGTWLHRIDPLFNGMGLTPGLDECLCKHLHTVHHPPIALQRLIVQSLSYRLLFHWPVWNQTQPWYRRISGEEELCTGTAELANKGWQRTCVFFYRSFCGVLKKMDKISHIQYAMRGQKITDSLTFSLYFGLKWKQKIYIFMLLCLYAASLVKGLYK